MDNREPIWVLLTGATGYLGQKILDELLRRDDVHVIAPLRAETSALLQQRTEALCGGRDAARIDVIAADLETTEPLAALLGRPITHIIHAAADTRFTIPAEAADAVNREGSRKVFEFARTLPALQSLVYLSTIYSCGLQDGEIAEDILPQRPDFANHYERSKFETEQLLATEYTDLPWQIHRTATVLAENTAGEVRQINVFHNTASLIYRGLISILPGAETTNIYLVDAEPVARNCVALCFEGYPYSVRHLCYPAAASLTLRMLIDALMARFADDPQFVARRIKPPLLTDLDSFLGVADVLSRGFTGLLLRQSVDSVRPFAPQLFSRKEFAVSLPDFIVHRGDEFAQMLLRNTLDYLMCNQWRTQPARVAS